MTKYLRILVFAALALALPIGATAEPVEVDVELVFLADASNSIDDAEIKFQRSGYANAVTHLDVLNAISKGDLGKIAVTFIEWGDDYSQDVVVPWTIVKDLASAKKFAADLLAAPRKAYGSNAIGQAIATAQYQIEQNNIKGHRKVIDLSGDSANNWNGIPIESARQRAVAAGITINGLAILCRADNCSGPGRSAMTSKRPLRRASSPGPAASS